MYQCLKVSEIKRADKPPYYLSSFLDLERAEVFKVYTSNYPSFDAGSSYELRIAPSFKNFNFCKMKNERVFPKFSKFNNLLHKLGARSISRRSCRRVCYSIAVICCCLALACVPSFAFSDVQVVPFYQMTKLDYGGTTSVVGISNNWTSITAVTEGRYASPLFYKLPENLVAGQSYIVSFDFSGDYFQYIFSLYKTNQWDDFSVTNRIIYSEGESSYYPDGHFEASFVFNGEPYLAFQFVLAPNRTIRLSPLSIQRVNPNAGVESRLDEQNSLLFDGEDVETLPDDGLNSQVDGFKSKLDELIANVNNIDFIERVKRGLLTINVLFDAFIYNGQQKPYSIKWILPLVNFSLFLGVIGSVLNIVRASSQEKHREKSESRGRKR